MNKEIEQKIEDIFNYAQEEATKRLKNSEHAEKYHTKIYGIGIYKNGEVVDIILEPKNREETPYNAIIFLKGEAGDLNNNNEIL